MADNYLEEMVAEWYAYQGYFVRKNVLVGKRQKGGYECELDVVAFHPEKKRLVHIEPSMDSDSWEKREARYQKKFAAGRKHIPKIFRGLDVPKEIDQIALLVYASKKSRTTLGGGRLVLIRELLDEIVLGMGELAVAKNIIPEQWPILRTIQFVKNFQP